MFDLPAAVAGVALLTGNLLNIYEPDLYPSGTLLRTRMPTFRRFDLTLGGRAGTRSWLKKEVMEGWVVFWRLRAAAGEGVDIVLGFFCLFFGPEGVGVVVISCAQDDRGRKADELKFFVYVAKLWLAR